ncbi:hypothetical protein [Streptomyces yaizuensis]|uniref:Nucleotidyltransferase domain-containing protein n=1 Tax=Streptomyces yaizuensis TaxID=2989713 RepID=A0ABQ5PAC9_9ACTN|nr:hypothetical protein [Streptomyces sp. YSPA8]GLF99186.1 nucleotidyltransferase domain-containing protein [Streptomyces sp. YSPA8]
MTRQPHQPFPSSQPSRPPLTFAAVVAAATADPSVAGLVLKGSHAHDGMATGRSDHDLYILHADGADSADAAGPVAAGALAGLDGHRSATLDLLVMPVGAFRRLGGYERYALARSRVLLDRLDGEITRIVAAKGRLNADEAAREAADRLDAYANSLYRSVKNARDGLALAARLDAADSVGFLLDVLFALDRRPRPYNKYLVWELERYPLPGWETTELVDAIDRISATGDVPAQRRLFARVESVARGAGLGDTLDAWGGDLLAMRPGADDAVS